jgi:hypothetical protein
MNTRFFPRDTRLSLALAAAALLLLSGCGTMAPQGSTTVHQEWDAAPVLPPLAPRYVEVAAVELPALCGDYPKMLLYGCAKRDYAKRECVIYTAPKPEQWLLDHERKHCAGYDHPVPGLHLAAGRLA